jgi:hypothetical protein
MYFTFSLSISFSFALFFEILYSICFTLFFFLGCHLHKSQMLIFMFCILISLEVCFATFHFIFYCFSFLWMGCIIIFVWKLKNCVVAMKVGSTMFIHLLLLFCWDGPPTWSFYCWVYHHGHWTIAIVFYKYQFLYIFNLWTNYNNYKYIFLNPMHVSS